MDDKQRIEKHIAKLFLERIEGTTLGNDVICFGNHLRNEPDILYKDMGIEIGAVLSEINTHIDTYEKNFLSKISERISGRIPETFQIRLVMQDDKDTVEHTPVTNFQGYRYLPKYLCGLFVYQSKCSQFDEKVVLNQKTRMRNFIFPNIRKGKEFNGFVDELAHYVNSLRLSDFVELHEFSLHHVVITKGKIKKYLPNKIDAFISQRIREKLCSNKYSGSYKKQILLLHNYSIIGNTEFSSDIHFYTHHRDDIFNLLWRHINEHKTFDFYAGVYFLDFSEYAFNSDFKLIDLRGYSPRKPSDFLNGYNEIRADFRATLLLRKRKGAEG